MKPETPLIRKHLRAPKAAAIAGIVFSVLLIISLVLLLLSIPVSLGENGAWLTTGGKSVLLALNLVPFAGIAFLWFMGVVRDRLGKNEDQFFATVFLGSGLLFLALLFASAAVSGSMILLYLNQPDRQLAAGAYRFGGTLARQLMTTYAIRMAGVFMISTSTLFIQTQVIPRWMGWLGYGLALIMLLRMGHIDRIGWVILSFPLWVLLISVYILIDNYRKKAKAAPT
ncbi:MAG TPA: hypothetical protein V6C65_29570 [Allocoleopsis sp.]